LRADGVAGEDFFQLVLAGFLADVDAAVAVRLAADLVLVFDPRFVADLGVVEVIAGIAGRIELRLHVADENFARCSRPAPRPVRLPSLDDDGHENQRGEHRPADHHGNRLLRHVWLRRMDRDGRTLAERLLSYERITKESRGAGRSRLMDGATLRRS